MEPQFRFRHLLVDTPEAREELEHLQALADANIERYGLLSDAPGPRDSGGADTVRRGGSRWG